MNILAGENLPLNINLKYIFFTEWKCLHYSKSPTCLFWKMYILYVLIITLRVDTNTGRLLSHVTNSHWLLPLNYHFLQLFFYSLFSLSSLVHWNAYWRKPKRSAWRWSGISVFSRDNSRQCFATTCSQYIGYHRGHLHCPTFSETAETNNRSP